MSRDRGNGRGWSVALADGRRAGGGDERDATRSTKLNLLNRSVCHRLPEQGLLLSICRYTAPQEVTDSSIGRPDEATKTRRLIA